MNHHFFPLFFDVVSFPSSMGYPHQTIVHQMSINPMTWAPFVMVVTQDRRSLILFWVGGCQRQLRLGHHSTCLVSCKTPSLVWVDSGVVFPIIYKPSHGLQQLKHLCTTTANDELMWNMHRSSRYWRGRI